MATVPHIGIDAMGGDHGPPVTVRASLRFLEGVANARVILVGRRDVIDAVLGEEKPNDRVSVQAEYTLPLRAVTLI